MCWKILSNFHTWSDLLLVSHRIHKASLTPPLSIEVPVTSLESERSCICVISILPVYDFSIGFWNCFDNVVFLFFILLPETDIDYLKLIVDHISLTYTIFLTSTHW